MGLQGFDPLQGQTTCDKALGRRAGRSIRFMRFFAETHNRP